MDRKSIIALVVCFIVLVLWYPLVVNKLYPPKTLAAWRHQCTRGGSILHQPGWPRHGATGCPRITAPLPQNRS